MATQVDVNGAIVPDTSGDTADLPTVTIQAGFDWQFWALLGLGLWWAFSHKKNRR